MSIFLFITERIFLTKSILFFTQINISLDKFEWEGEDLGKLSTRQAARAANPPPPGISHIHIHIRDLS